MHEKFVFHGGWASFDPLDFDGSSKGKFLDAEQTLMLAVLRSAVDDFQKYVHGKGGIEKKLFRQAEEWILEKNTTWVFSFENICESLQLEPKYIRRGLLSWKEEKRALTLSTRPDATAANSADAEKSSSGQRLKSKTLRGLQAVHSLRYIVPMQAQQR